MPKRISAADPVAVRVAIVTMDNHLAGPVERARRALARDIPGLTLELHCATEWTRDAAALARCREGIARADVIVATMLFVEDHFQPVLDALRSRLALALSTEDVREGVAAFREKREPRWTMR